jgi:hypothetical protein
MQSLHVDAANFARPIRLAIEIVAKPGKAGLGFATQLLLS